MVDLSRRRIETELLGEDDGGIKGYDVSVEVGDAMMPPSDTYDVIFSAFGLQQLPRPLDAISAWMGRLADTDGICVVIYWPPIPPPPPPPPPVMISGRIEEEEEKDKDDATRNPFEAWDDLLRKKLGTRHNEEECAWDVDMSRTIRDAGGEILHDGHVTHDIKWKDGKDMFEGMSNAGPWHAMRLRRGNEFVDELGEELMMMYPVGTPLVHPFTARMIVARRRRLKSKNNDGIGNSSL
jgi:hypothetical protein